MKIGWQALGGILGPGPRLPMARTLHLWPFLALFGHKMGQNGWNKKDMLWISIQVDPNDNLKALVLAKQKLEKR